jgi:uncharacterized protein YyaL (SSP411 family)
MKRMLFTMICGIFLFQQYAGASDFRFSPRPNKARLIHWRTWSQATLDEARKKNRLIVLSLSAVWCHWCHVMDETTYSDEAVISFINENFIPIRVDADLRPDIDALYNQGGWPSTAILTPQGEVVSGGNYIPPEEMLGRLKRVAALSAKDPGAIRDRIDELRAVKELRGTAGEETAGALDKNVIDNIVKMLKRSFDRRNGGFGTGQKFPSPDSIDFLLAQYETDRDEDIEQVVTLTLDRMAQSEIFDKLRGGFFRYATKPDWSEPHYEKMLDVNAGMIGNYAAVSLALGKKEYAYVIRKTMQYVLANLYDAANGVFFGSQDADETYYRKQQGTNAKKPLVDRTIYADSSSLMISALIAAQGAVPDRQYLGMAIRSADFLLLNLYSASEGMFHYFRDGVPQLKGLLSDNALAGSALLDLYNATGDIRYLKSAQEIGKLIINRFYDADKRRFRPSLNTAAGQPVTVGPLSEVNGSRDNFRAIRFLGRLTYTGEDCRLKEINESVAATYSREYQQFTPHAAMFGNALIWIVEEPVQITILADGDNRRKYLSVISGIYVPEKAVQVFSLSRDREEIAKRKYPLRESVYLCVGTRCSAPMSDPERLGVALRKLAGRASRDGQNGSEDVQAK